MKALTYHGPQDVRYESVPDPVVVVDPRGVLVFTASPVADA